MFITNTAIDLKINEKGEVKILEFEAAHHAGCEGYRAVTGKDMMEDVVYPWMEEFFDVPVWRPDAEEFFSRKSWDYMRNHPETLSDKDKLDTIIVSPSRYYIQPWMIRHNLCHGMSVPIVSANSGFLQLTANKSYMDYAADMAELARHDEDVPDGSDYKPAKDGVFSLFPDTSPCPRDYNSFFYDKMLDEFKKEHKQYVIKLANESQHHGLILANRENLDSIMYQISEREDKIKGRAPKLPQEWRENNAPLYSIQEKVKSRPIEKNGKQYDGTMRVFATIWHEPIGREGSTVELEPHIEVHDGYWKLPPNPIGPGHAFNQCVSFCPSSVDDSHPDKMKICRDHFALVSDEDMQRVHDTLKSRNMNFFLSQLLVDSVGRDPAAHLLSVDIDNVTGVFQDLGAMLVLNSGYYNGAYMQAKRGNDNALKFNQLVPQNIFNSLSNIYKIRPENSFLRRYMNDIAAGKDYHFVLTDRRLKGRLRSLTGTRPKIPTPRGI